MKLFWSLITRKQTSLGSAALVLMLMVVLSGILGLLRLRVLYLAFTPEQTGVFFAAFRLPNLLFGILAMGTLTTAFIPVFSKYLAKDDVETAHKMASTVINLTVLALTLLAVPLVIFTPFFSRIFAPGFSAPQISEMSSYTRFMILAQVIPLVIGNFFTGVLQSYNLFVVPAAAPVFYNLGIIVGILLFAPTLGIYSAVIGVGMGAFLFMAVQIPIILYVGYRHRWLFRIRQTGVMDVIKLMVPRMIGLGASQIDVTVDLVLSSLLGSKMVSVFFLAQSLQQLPVRLFGSTISQATLPVLSSAWAKTEKKIFITSIVSSFHMVLFLVFPSAMFFVVLRTPIVRLAFGASRFDWEATVLTAVTLSIFSISMFAAAVSQVFVRGFYAIYDSRTPVAVSLFSIAINSVFSVLFILVFRFPVWSLAVSASLASIINAFSLIILFCLRVRDLSVGDMVYKPIKMFIVSLISALTSYISMKLFDQIIFDTTRVFGLLLMTVSSVGLGLAVYIFFSWVLDVAEVRSIFRLMEKIRKLRHLFIEPSTGLVTNESMEN